MRFAADLIWRLHLSRCGARFEGASVVSNYGLGFRGARMLGPEQERLTTYFARAVFLLLTAVVAKYGWHA
jgi:hypothetical protein